MTYAEKLRNPKWQKKRLDILNRDSFSCRNCLSKDKTLHVHHLAYLSGKEPWEYEDDYLLTLCEDCHKDAENTKIQNNKKILECVNVRINKDFERECFIKVFESYKNIDYLIYLLWELRDVDHSEVEKGMMELQNRLMPPTPELLELLEKVGF